MGRFCIYKVLGGRGIMRERRRERRRERECEVWSDPETAAALAMRQ